MNSDQPLIVDVDLKESDLQRATFWFRLGRWWSRLLLVLLVIVGFLSLWRFRDLNLLHNPLAATLPTFLILFPFLYPLIVWYQTNRTFASLQEFQKSLQYSFTPSGYTVRDLKSSSNIDWDTIMRAVESKHSFNFFFHKSLFHAVPKRCFRDHGDIVRLRELLKASIGTRATMYQ
jgi:YcxB-like protein